MLTVKRKKLVEIALEATAEVHNEQERLALIGTAVTVDEVLLGGWFSSGCGCLVGSLYHAEFEQATPVNRHHSPVDLGEMITSDVVRAGFLFDSLLREHIRETQEIEYENNGEEFPHVVVV